jgi:tRNA A37 threonylcarbamoyladenosine modification protein TsaB
MARNTLESRRHPHEHNGFGLVIPAGQDALFCQAYTCCGGEASEILVLADDEASEWFAKRVSSVAGPGATRVAQAAEKRGVLLTAGIEGLVPNAETLAKMAFDLDPASDVPVPMYIRPADAKPQTAGIVTRKDEG